MPKWKKLNAETGNYEEIPGAGWEVPAEKVYWDLIGKTAIFMGDSYTVGMSAILQTMCAEFGMVADNRGVASSTICGDSGGDKGWHPMWKRTKEVCEEYTTAGKTEDVAVIVFMGGANDGFGPSTWIGESITDTNHERIYGAMHSLMNDFRKTFPKAKIITVLQPANFVRTVAEFTDEETAKFFGFESLAALQAMDDYQFCMFAHSIKERAVQEVAEFYGTEIIDCCFNWHSVMSAADREKYWLSDKLHMTGAGNEDIVSRIRAKIAELFK